MMKRLFVWGAGDIGKRILSHLDEKWDIVFVDINKEKANIGYQNRKVISVEEYIQKYSDQFILVAHLHEASSISILQANNINNYFIHCDLPGDFKEPYIRNHLKEYIINYLSNRTNYVLYGLGIYSLIIDEWIFTHFGIHPYILKQDNLSNELKEKIVQQYDELNIIEDIQQLSGIEEVCVCLDNYAALNQTDIFENYHLTDIYDCTGRIKAYHNIKIEKFNNIHNGQRCFIVATGPSLKMEDLTLIKERKEISIGMNTVFYAFSKTEWRPDYYVMYDWRGLQDYSEIIDTLPIEVMFLGDTFEPFWKVPHEKNIYWYHEQFEYCYDRLPKFSNDFSKRSYEGCTVTYTCLQLAVYMGFKEIYLLGVDFTDGETTGGKYGHFHVEDELVATCFKNQVWSAYTSARRYADQHGIKIYNATRGGKLEVFPRVDFDSLFQ